MKKIIEFEVPGFDELKKAFADSASVSDRKTSIQVGNYRATKLPYSPQAGYDIRFGIYEYPDGPQIEILQYKGDNIVVAAQEVINHLAEIEAHKAVAPEAINTAYRAALAAEYKLALDEDLSRRTYG